MESLASVTSNIREPQLPVIGRYGNQYDENQGRSSEHTELQMENLVRLFSVLSDPSEGRSWLTESAETFRSDALTDIRTGLSKVGTVIKIVSAVLSLFGGPEPIDRNDGMEETIGTWMDVGATVLKVGLSKFSDSAGTSGVTSVDKLGVAASTSPQASDQDLLHKQQVAAFVSKLTPEQIRLKQQLVIDHVKQEAVKQGLSAGEAEAMLAQTLEYNGLPGVSSNPLTGALDSLFKIGSNTVNKIGLPAPTQTSSQPAQDLVPGLPVPGTLEHTVALALFNAQQYINQALSGTTQPAIDNKLGVAAGASETDGSVISAVSSLPASLSNAAVQVLKFVGQPSPSSSSGSPGQSYSEVVTGVDPTYTALGVLTTGALASVAFSYVASDSDIASSASDLALGAVDAIARNDLVQNIANNDLVERITNNEIVRKATDAISNNKLLRKATSAIASLKNKLSGNRDGSYDPTKFYNIDNNYEDADYGDYGAGLYQTNFDYYQEVAYTDRYPYQESRVSDPPQYSEDDGWHLEEAWDENIQWFEPEKSPAVPETVSHVPYSEDHNPWHLMNTGQSTDHLYRGFTN